MITVQQFGTEVSQRNLRQFYIFCGSEYGVKARYLDIISDIYNHNRIEVETVERALQMMSVKSLISKPKTLYIIRYDDDFVKSIDKHKDISSYNINGTIVLVTESEQQSFRCDKFMPDNTVIFDPVDRRFVKKYLIHDYPDIDDFLIDYILNFETSYIKAQNVCDSLNTVDKPIRNTMSQDEISCTFGSTQSISADAIKVGIAARDPKYCLNVLSRYDGTSDSVAYAILNVLLEIEKCITYNWKCSSPYQKYRSVWSINDVHSMFSSVYELIKKSRQSGSFDLMSSLECVICLMSYSPMPKFSV